MHGQALWSFNALLQPRVADKICVGIQRQPITAFRMRRPPTELCRQARHRAWKIGIHNQLHVAGSRGPPSLRVIGQAQVGDALLRCFAPEIIESNRVLLSIKAPKPVECHGIGISGPELLPAQGVATKVTGSVKKVDVALGTITIRPDNGFIQEITLTADAAFQLAAPLNESQYRVALLVHGSNLRKPAKGRLRLQF